MGDLKFHLHIICIILNVLIIPNQVHTFTYKAMVMQNLVILGSIVSEKNSGQDLVVKKEERKKERKK